jgi:predicted amidohydrolase
LDLYICAGIAEDDRGIHYNTQFIVGPEGYLGKQRKVHLSRDEHYYFRGGTAVPVIELPMARVGIVICYDNLFPELSRCLAVQGAELLLCVHAARFGKWPRDAKGRRKAVENQRRSWRLIHSCRAYDNGCYVALCNMVGQGGVPGVEANHAGVCMVFGPGGELVAESRSKDIAEEMLVVELDSGKVAERRREPCFNLQTRRPEVFSVLSQPTE